MTVGTIGLLFFIFGFVTWLNGILIPYLKISCELNHFESYLVAFSFYVAYVIMAIPSSWLLKKTGLKMGMMLGLFVMAGGALFFIPAAMTRTYSLFLSGLFIMGTGLAILQTAANPYITMLGPIESAAQRISIMGICNKSAGVIATFLFGVMALKDGDALLASLKTMDVTQKAAALERSGFQGNHSISCNGCNPCNNWDICENYQDYLRSIPMSKIQGKMKSFIVQKLQYSNFPIPVIGCTGHLL